jgi:hypothetical protein
MRKTILHGHPRPVIRPNTSRELSHRTSQTGI